MFELAEFKNEWYRMINYARCSGKLTVQFLEKELGFNYFGLLALSDEYACKRDVEGVHVAYKVNDEGDYNTILFKKTSVDDRIDIVVINAEVNMICEIIASDLNEEYKWRLNSVEETPEFDPNDRHMVFCIIYCDKESTPYEDYDVFTEAESLEKKRVATLNVPMVLMQYRWDGKIGFPGGNVEKHHTSLLDALKDELHEELNFNVTEEELKNLVKPFRTYSKRDAETGKVTHIHSYKMEVSYEMFKQIHLNAPAAKHFLAETGGPIAVQILESNIGNVFNHAFAGTAGRELKSLVYRERLVEKSGADTKLTKERFPEVEGF